MCCMLPLDYAQVSLVYTEVGILNDGSYHRPAHCENGTWIHCQLPNCLQKYLHGHSLILISLQEEQVLGKVSKKRKKGL